MAYATATRSRHCMCARARSCPVTVQKSSFILMQTWWEPWSSCSSWHAPLRTNPVMAVPGCEHGAKGPPRTFCGAAAAEDAQITATSAAKTLDIAHGARHLAGGDGGKAGGLRRLLRRGADIDIGLALLANAPA